MSKIEAIILSVVLEGRSQTETAERFGVSKGWVSKLVARYKIDGDQAFEPKSRRPRTSPSRLDGVTVELICTLRKEITDQGLDAGPETIQWHLEQHHDLKVSVSSIRRRLVDAGLVEPNPKKRPKSSYVRFEADLPNQTWQTDFTHWQLSAGTGVEIISWLDDHSRYALSVTAHKTITSKIVTDSFNKTAKTEGFPTSVLSDNGLVYTTRFAGGKGGLNRFEQQLADKGITQKNSRPGHPTTCGKVERFQQTLKKWLTAQPDAHDIEDLQTQIDAFVDEYNNKRPHRSLNRRTPNIVYYLLQKDKPNKKPEPHHRIRKDIDNKEGKVTLRHAGKLHHIWIGRKHGRTPITMIINGLNIRAINTQTGEQLRELTLNPNKNYQPQPKNKKTP